jgi:hypothetical protein
MVENTNTIKTKAGLRVSARLFDAYNFFGLILIGITDKRDLPAIWGPGRGINRPLSAI